MRILGLALAAVSMIHAGASFAGDCTDGSLLAKIRGTRTCDRGGSSAPVCVQDPDGRVECGTGDGVTSSRILELGVYATQADAVDDGVSLSGAIQVWGVGDPENGKDDSDWTESRWCCFFTSPSSLRVVMNDSNNFVRYGCLTGVLARVMDGQLSQFHVDLDLRVPTETDLKQGDDEFVGGSGDDSVRAGPGADIVEDCDGGDDHFQGEAGDDMLWGGLGADTLEGGDDSDELLGYSGDDQLDGGGGVDVLHGEAGSDVIYGGDGNDEIEGGRGDDSIFGGDGADEIRGGDGDDCIHGDERADRIFGGDGQDLICGGTGDDVLKGRSNPDVIFGEEGVDIAGGGTGTDACDAERESSCPLDPTAEDLCSKRCVEGIERRPRLIEEDETDIESLKKRARKDRPTLRR